MKIIKMLHFGVYFIGLCVCLVYWKIAHFIAWRIVDFAYWYRGVKR